MKSLNEQIQERIDRIRAKASTPRELVKIPKWTGIYWDKLNSVYVAKLGQRIIGEYSKAEVAADAYNEAAIESMGSPRMNHTKKFLADQDVEETPQKIAEVSKKEKLVKEVLNEPRDEDKISKLLKELSDLDQGTNDLDGLSDLSASSK